LICDGGSLVLEGFSGSLVASPLYAGSVSSERLIDGSLVANALYAGSVTNVVLIEGSIEFICNTYGAPPLTVDAWIIENGGWVTESGRWIL
jgi:hypothetical protein